jgi:hypothetical protein
VSKLKGIIQVANLKGGATTTPSSQTPRMATPFSARQPRYVILNQALIRNPIVEKPYYPAVKLELSRDVEVKFRDCVSVCAFVSGFDPLYIPHCFPLNQ